MPCPSSGVLSSLLLACSKALAFRQLVEEAALPHLVVRLGSVEGSCVVYDLVEYHVATRWMACRGPLAVAARSSSSPLLCLQLLFLLDDSGAVLDLGDQGGFLALDDSGAPPLLPLLYFCLLRVASSLVA